MSILRSSVVGLAVLAAMAVILAKRAYGDIVTVNPEAVPAIAPLSIHVASSYILPDALRKQFGLVEKSAGFNGILGENPNPSYQKTFPFPSMTYERTRPFQLYTSFGPGIKAVLAYRYHWPWPPPNPNSLPPEEKVVLWRWNVPEALIESYPAWVCRYGIERYAALCLYSPARPLWKRDPIVFYFDGLSGLLWQTELSVSATPLPPVNGKILDVREDQCVFLGMTSDGARILALVNPKPDCNCCLLFVLNDRGEIPRTLLIPDRIGIGESWDIKHSTLGTRFLLRMDHIIPLKPEEGKGRYRREGETYLVDREGNLLGRFVDETGHSVDVAHLGDAYAAGEQPADGKHRHLIYRLPKDLHAGESARP
jgi:hypothetical protein